jgi:hypothetical protein
MLLSQKKAAEWIEIYESSDLVPKGLKTFVYFQKSGEKLDFSAVIDWLKPQGYHVHEIERFWIIFDIIGSYHIVIDRVNPPRPPIVHIVIDNYEGYKNFGSFDLRGVKDNGDGADHR